VLGETLLLRKEAKLRGMKASRNLNKCFLFVKTLRTGQPISKFLHMEPCATFH